jgi:hypothetical protein
MTKFASLIIILVPGIITIMGSLCSPPMPSQTMLWILKVHMVSPVVTFGCGMGQLAIVEFDITELHELQLDEIL